MSILGLSLGLAALFVGFGLLIGILFGFFGMGGSFLVTPALLVMGYPAKVAVGSGLAFVFGTSIIAALRHRDLGQVDYKLGAMFVVGMTAGIEVGKRLVLVLEAAGLADTVVSVAYVVLLATVGLFVLRDARTADDGDGEDNSAILRALRRVRLPPVITLKGDIEVSIWVGLTIAFAIGILSGFLGVGGGFLLMPAMMYGLGVPAAVAVGTDVFQITISGAFGAFRYAQEGAVSLPVVTTLLAGSALGARVGAAATDVVDEDAIKGYFAAMLLAGALAVASKKLGTVYAIDLLSTVSMALIFGAAILVSGAILYRAAVNIRQESRAESLAD
ncbi:sulfite exporter TauE/SafE family protein [Haladaptatus sp. CMSO5]|uniref:sulfite exporter TauE/SafE family protein n=1 Tax=Haladaptatus sp. CMSO5 TaxID=3120514 RepID=UPI002FCDFF92